MYYFIYILQNPGNLFVYIYIFMVLIHDAGGQRNWIQVFCNGGVASVLALLYIVDNGVGERPVDYAKDLNASLVCIAILGALSCSNGDTWASEIGSAIGSRTPRLITTFKKVPVGTNGAITVAGTLASIAGGALIGLAYYITQTACLAIVYRLGQPHYPPQWPIIMLGCIAGFVGSAVDSLLGATVQYSGYCSERKRVVYKPTSTSKHITGIGLLDNHLVNLVSSAITATITPVIGYYIWRTLSEAEGSAVYL